jgi:glycolate oxidase iron-sulfur subunit
MDSPRGRIYLMRAFDEGRAEISDSFTEHMFRCLDCRACETACPSGVQFGRMMEDMRAVIVKGRGASRMTRLALNHIFPHPRRFRMAARLLKLYQLSGMQALVRSGPGRRVLQSLAPSLAAAEALTPRVEIGRGVALNSVHRAKGERVGKVAFFTGCVMNSMMGRVNRASVRLLQAAGYDVIVPGKQVCCGALANHAGLRDTATKMAAVNVGAFGAADIEAIIINAAGCGAMLKEYGHLLPEAAGFASKVKDISEFLAGTRIREHLRRPLARRVGYDDPCHLVHGQRVRAEPRALISAIPEIEFVEIEGADQCCGSAGVYNITQNAISMQILDAKMEKIRASGVEILVTGNPGCMFQFRYGAGRAGMKLKVVHPVELLADALG